MDLELAYGLQLMYWKVGAGCRVQCGIGAGR